MASERKDQILDAGLEVFGRYGYGKATMQEIAAAVGISRAALYQHFRTKEELFQAGARRTHDRALAAVAEALAVPGEAVGRAAHAIAAYFEALTAPVATSPHRGELLDTSRSITAELARDSREALLTQLANALAAAVTAGELRLPATVADVRDVARLLLVVAEGLVKTSSDPVQWRRDRALFFRLIAAALAAPAPAPVPVPASAGTAR